MKNSECDQIAYRTLRQCSPSLRGGPCQAGCKARTARRLSVIVADTGPGIPGDKDDHIFHWFPQGRRLDPPGAWGSAQACRSAGRCGPAGCDGTLELVSEEGVGRMRSLPWPYLSRTGAQARRSSRLGRRPRRASRTRIMVFGLFFSGEPELFEMKTGPSSPSGCGRPARGDDLCIGARRDPLALLEGAMLRHDLIGRSNARKIGWA